MIAPYPGQQVWSHFPRFNADSGLYLQICVATRACVPFRPFLGQALRNVNLFGGLYLPVRIGP